MTNASALSLLVQDTISPNRLDEVAWLKRYLDTGCKAGAPIFLSLGETWERTPETLLEIAAKAPRHVHGYHIAMAGYPPLRQKLHNMLVQEYDLNDDWWTGGLYEVGVCATGTRSLMYDFSRYLAATYVQGRRPILMTFAPGWDYAGVFKSAGFVPQYINMCPESGFSLDAAALMQSIEVAVADPGVALVFALNVQQNPTGQNISESIVSSLVSELVRKGIPILLDDAYFAVTAPDEEPTCAMRLLLMELSSRQGGGDYPWLLVRSLGKQFSCNGWGIGVAAGPPRLLEELFNVWQIEHHYNINGLFQYAMSEWIGLPQAKEFILQQRRDIHSNRLLFLSLLEKRLGYPPMAGLEGCCTSFQIFPVPRPYVGRVHAAQHFVRDCVATSGVLFTDVWPLPYNKGSEFLEYDYARVFLATRSDILEEAVSRMERAKLYFD